MSTNGKSAWVRWGIKTLIILLLVLVGNVVANDQLSRKRDTEITKEMIHRDDEVEDCLTKKIEQVEDIVTDIRLEQREHKILLRAIKKKL